MDKTTNRWRTVDIVVASDRRLRVIWAWGLLWNGPADAIPMPARAVLYGMWLCPESRRADPQTGRRLLH